MQPIFEAYDDIAGAGPHPTTVFLSPCGEPFTDAVACELSREGACCSCAATTKASTSAPTRWPIA